MRETTQIYTWEDLPLLIESLIGAGSEVLLECLLSKLAGREVKEYSKKTNLQYQLNKKGFVYIERM